MGALVSPNSPAGKSPAGKWLGFVTAIWVQSISGNKYTFSNYSDALKSLMVLTQLQLNNLSSAKDVGKAFGLLAGFASDRLSTPVVLLIGSVEGLVGYGVQWLVVSQKIQPLPYWQMCIFMCMGGNSTTWMNTAVLVTCIKENRGYVSGILKGYIGLSTVIFTDLCSALFSDSPSTFLLMLSIVPFLVCLAAMLLPREADPADADDKDEESYFCVFNTVTVVIAVCLLVFDVSGEHGRAVSRAFAVVLLVLMAVPVVVYAWWKAKRVTDLKQDTEQDPEEEGRVEGEVEVEVGVPIYARWKAKRVTEEIRAPLLNKGEEEGGSVEEKEETKRRRPVIGEEHTIVDAFKTVDFWILSVSFLCGGGTGLAVMNNMGQMGRALGYVDVSKFVKLTRIFGFVGRLGSGSISECFIKKSVTPRPLWNAASQILMAVGYVIMAMALPGSLYIGSIIVGLCHGGRLTVTVLMASELFGLKNYGLIYNILILNLTLGSFLFSGLLTGCLYDDQATRTHGGGGNTCVGAHCYQLVFVIMALACIVGFGLDLVLAFRTKSFDSENPNEQLVQEGIN